MAGQTYTLSWKIENFRLCTHKIGQAIVSRCFVTGKHTDAICIALLFPRARQEPDLVSFYLTRPDGSPTRNEMRATLQLVGADGNKTSLMEDLPVYGTFGVSKHASRSDVDRLYIHNDTLKLQWVLKKTADETTNKWAFARTSVNFRKICKEWTLTNFFGEVRNGDVLEEPVGFMEGSPPLIDVCLSVKQTPGQKEAVIEFTRRGDPPERPLTLNTLVTVRDTQGVESEIWKQDQHVFRKRTSEEVWQIPILTDRVNATRQKDKHLANKVLKVKCEVALSLGTLTSTIEDSSLTEKMSDVQFVVDKLEEDMRDLHICKRFPDAKFRVDGETVPVHKIVMRARSEKFAEMLEDIEGTDNDVLDVPDVDMITLKRMLKYMYTDEIDDLEYDDAVAAYTAANKYRIESLKCKCSFALQSYLQSSNACSILMLSDEFCDQDLKKYALDFIKGYWDLVGVSQEWEDLLTKRQSLAQEVKEHLA